MRLSRQESESWLDAALRAAKPYHLEAEVKAAYEQHRRNGDSEITAAWAACHEFDLLKDGVQHSL